MFLMNIQVLTSFFLSQQINEFSMDAKHVRLERRVNRFFYVAIRVEYFPLLQEVTRCNIMYLAEWNTVYYSGFS